ADADEKERLKEIYGPGIVGEPQGAATEPAGSPRAETLLVRLPAEKATDDTRQNWSKAVDALDWLTERVSVAPEGEGDDVVCGLGPLLRYVLDNPGDRVGLVMEEAGAPGDRKLTVAVLDTVRELPPPDVRDASPLWIGTVLRGEPGVRLPDGWDRE